MKTFRFRNRPGFRTGLFTLSLLLFSWALAAQTIGGKVFDACTGAPIAGAIVRISVNPPGSVPGSWSIPTALNGSWNFSFQSGDPNGPYLVTVSGGASSPGSYIYYRSNGNNNGMNFNLLRRNFDVAINGQDIFWQNNPSSPHTVCRNVQNCVDLVETLDGVPVANGNYCYKVTLYRTNAGGQPGTLLAESNCNSFGRIEIGNPCDPGSFDLSALLAGIEGTLPPVIRMEVQQFCYSSRCVPGEGVLVNTEVVFIEVLDEVLLGFQFLAGDFVDELNGPPTDDGLVSGSTQLPGPFLGAATIGLNIGAFSDDENVLSWQYTIEEVDCTTGASLVTLFVSPVDDDGGPLPENETFIDKFIGPPGQQIQGYFPLGTGLIPGVNYTANKCYKVTLGTNTVCGGSEVFSYFRIQQAGENGLPCPFCIIVPPGIGSLSPVAAESTLSIAPNPSSGRTTLTVASVEEVYSEFTVYDLKGQAVLTVFKGILEKGKRNIVLDLSPFPQGIYFLKGQIGNKPVVEKIIVQ